MFQAARRSKELVRRARSGLTDNEPSNTAEEVDTHVVSIMTKAKSVRFIADPEEDAASVTQSRKSGSDMGVRTRADAFSWRGGASSKRKRRRRWKKFVMYMNPRMWLHFLNKWLPIIMPHDLRRRYWDFGILILVIYNALLIPYQVGFGGPQNFPMQCLDRVIDAVFWVDIGLNFRTAYMDHMALMVRDGRKIALHYLMTWFVIDACGSIPFDVLITLFFNNLSPTALVALSLLRTPRLLRIGRLLRFFDRMKGASVVRMVRLFSLLALVVHWITCLWHLIYRLAADKDSGTIWSFDTQIGANSAQFTIFLNWYIYSFFVMVGNDIEPQNNGERLYLTLVVVVGACFYAVIVGQTALLVNNMNPTAARHKFKKDIVLNTARYLDAPPEITTRINTYYDYLTTYSHPGPDGMALIQHLPSSMSQDIFTHLYQDLVLKVPLFKECEPSFIMALVTRLRLAVFLPGDVIFQNGDVGHEMYFITKGHVAVHNTHNELLSMLHVGGFFGELALLATSRRTAKCVAVSHCDLSQLSANDLVVAMRDFPESGAKVRASAKRRMQYLQTAGRSDDNVVATHGGGGPSALSHSHTQHGSKKHGSLRFADSTGDGSGGGGPAAGHGERHGGSSSVGSSRRASEIGGGRSSVMSGMSRGSRLSQGHEEDRDNDSSCSDDSSDAELAKDPSLLLFSGVQAAIQKLIQRADALQAVVGQTGARLARVEQNRKEQDTFMGSTPGHAGPMGFGLHDDF